MGACHTEDNNEHVSGPSAGEILGAQIREGPKKHGQPHVGVDDV